MAVFTLSFPHQYVFTLYCIIFLKFIFYQNKWQDNFLEEIPLEIEEHFKFTSFIEEIQTASDSVGNKNVRIKNGYV